ncbi:CLUMA_CG006171, isoform A [Clunio marinus]|uniref:CLUMA_CG006171, isoform A n=1 Tax=Clunio marinus TaxID=568069 RepID=A0A1J1HX55_9DIPT|nr:CLUMA_CG006171, isoform A [Clunio marinus]
MYHSEKIRFFIVMFGITSVTAFQFKAGQCPEVTPMRDFDMNRFLGLWHVVEGTLTNKSIECLTFNVTKLDSNTFAMTQLPQNLTSKLIPEHDIPGRMNIGVNASSDANFSVLITDYNNFAGFFICKNSSVGNFYRAAAVLSRTKQLSSLQHNIVKEYFHSYDVADDDLTGIINTC